MHIKTVKYNDRPDLTVPIREYILFGYFEISSWKILKLDSSIGKTYLWKKTIFIQGIYIINYAL